MHDYPFMLSPLSVRGRRLRNRVVMGSMHTRLENERDGIRRQQAFYAERATGGVAAIVTGGYAPNHEGRVEEGAPVLDTPKAADALRPIVDVVHAEGALILMQILHAGRYARHSAPVGASTLRSPINPVPPRALLAREVERTIDDYVRCAELAEHAGFDGVEIMGSEGYFINQFTAPHTNNRDDEWGGDAERRARMPVEIMRRTRQRVSTDFLLMYRISALDLVSGGCTRDEILELARQVEAAGADILNTGIGWHEARIPTVAYFVPRAAWRLVARRLKEAVRIPVMASNRINVPEVAEDLLSAGDADLVSLARPMLADPSFVKKAATGRRDEINTCIACNQACLDFIFREKIATCLVNPRAGRELEFEAAPAPRRRKRVAVVGAGAAGLACAIQAAERGHRVELYEAGGEIGGQLNYAARIPAKQEFRELLRYFAARLRFLEVRLYLNRRPNAGELVAGGFDHIVVATGVVPRVPAIPGIDNPNVLLYTEALRGRRRIGRRVAIIGAGGIGFDVAAYLLQNPAVATDPERFDRQWGIGRDGASRGGLCDPEAAVAPRQVYLLQRSAARFGRTLGPSTGWVLRHELARLGVRMIGGCEYRGLDAGGIDFAVQGEPRRIEVDSVIICAGQESERSLAAALGDRAGVQVIGGAHRAGEIDALRAIEQGTRAALEM